MKHLLKSQHLTRLLGFLMLVLVLAMPHTAMAASHTYALAMQAAPGDFDGDGIPDDIDPDDDNDGVPDYLDPEPRNPQVPAPGQPKPTEPNSSTNDKDGDGIPDDLDPDDDNDGIPDINDPGPSPSQPSNPSKPSPGAPGGSVPKVNALPSTGAGPNQSFITTVIVAGIGLVMLWPFRRRMQHQLP